MHPDTAHALSVALHKMAYELDMNPLDFYRKVFIEDDMVQYDTGRPLTNNALRVCLEKAAEVIGYEDKWHMPGEKTLDDGRLHGIGIASYYDRHGTTTPGWGMVIYMNTDGTANFVTGQSNNQNGSCSVTFPALIAEALGLPFDHVYCSSYGTPDQAPDGSGQFGSQGATKNGMAAFNAALDVRQQLFDFVAEELGVDPENLHAANGEIFVKDDPGTKMTHREAMAQITKPIIGVGRSTGEILRRPFQGYDIGEPCFFRSGVATAWEIAVDPETGEVELLDFVHVYDAGRVIDRFQSEGQLSSALWSQWSRVFMWDIHHDPQTGALLDQTFLDMKAATAMDIPNEGDLNQNEFLELVDALGPFGMHGLGEPGVHACGQAALNDAIINATGVWNSMRPVQPDRMLKLLGKV